MEEPVARTVAVVHNRAEDRNLVAGQIAGLVRMKVAGRDPAATRATDRRRICVSGTP